MLCWWRAGRQESVGESVAVRPAGRPLLVQPGLQGSPASSDPPPPRPATGAGRKLGSRAGPPGLQQGGRRGTVSAALPVVCSLYHTAAAAERSLEHNSFHSENKETERRRDSPNLCSRAAAGGVENWRPSRRPGCCKLLPSSRHGELRVGL